MLDVYITNMVVMGFQTISPLALMASESIAHLGSRNNCKIVQQSLFNQLPNKDHH